MEWLSMFSLRQSLPLRIVFALVVLLVAKGFFELNVMWLISTLKKRLADLDEKTFFNIVQDCYYAKLDHWKYPAMILGYMMLFGENPGEGMAYTFPGALYGVFAETNELEWFWSFVLAVAYPLFLVSAFRILLWLKDLKGLAVTLVLSHHAKAIGLGMLIGQGFEILSRLIAMANPTSGSLLYFAFHLLVNLGQILFIAYCGINFAVGFFTSFLTTESQKELLAEMKVKREYERSHPSSGGGGGGVPSSAPSSKFPNYMQASNGDLYRLENDSGDHATYICDKTGHRKTVWDVDLDT